MTSKKQNASDKGGARPTKLAGGVGGQIKVLKCSDQYISKLRREVRKAGLFLRDTTGRSQREALLNILQYLGGRGLNTPEAVGLGVYRVATRVHELQEAGYLITSHPERIEGPDGLVHCRIARYVFSGVKADAQGKLDLGE
ncbi:hypothetical protein HUX88_29050 [Duganella sp. BJB1802]|uniref:helix-turn-helix domain-containing protein n=1 Tax=Duganella sp. BJB1802 TaxID=2744575 RepID=UPI001594867A|nr:helix-turn-helix domain-containing protein [Duganella sp. BJB1802]NVD74536.1 hypothetical protein [Duganella sp. BJB1802]